MDFVGDLEKSSLDRSSKTILDKYEKYSYQSEITLQQLSNTIESLKTQLQQMSDVLLQQKGKLIALAVGQDKDAIFDFWIGCPIPIRQHCFRCIRQSGSFRFGRG